MKDYQLTNKQGGFMNNKTRYHWSDCSLHNMPAMPNKPCNCGGDAPPPKSKSNKLKEGDIYCNSCELLNHVVLDID